MVDEARQVPSASALAWMIDLAHVDGPRFVVCRVGDDDARQALVRHLVDIGSISHTIEAERIVAVAPAESVGVVW
jgi:hypothetical protein